MTRFKSKNSKSKCNAATESVNIMLSLGEYISNISTIFVLLTDPLLYLIGAGSIAGMIGIGTAYPLGN
jgi:hypothetical protein